MKLYEITEQYRQELAALEEIEGLDAETIENTLAATKGEAADKMKAVMAFTLNCDSDIAQLKEVETRIKNRRQALENRRDSFREYLKRNMVACGITEIAANDLSWKAKLTKPQKVVEIRGEVPEEYARVTVSPDKTAIKNALKAGADLSFAALVDGEPGLRVS